MPRVHALFVGAVALLVAIASLAGNALASRSQRSATFLASLHVLTPLGTAIPANGDLNPYGVAVVRRSEGALVAGDTLVSNFNAKRNVQGTGTTIVEIAPNGSSQLFAQIVSLPQGVRCPGGVGLDTALGILPGGWVVVGSLPTVSSGELPSGDPAGCLLVLDSSGHVVSSIVSPSLVGPWDLVVGATTPASEQVFVSNALGGNTKTSHGVPVAGECTVVRLGLALHGSQPPTLRSATRVGVDFPWRANTVALILAPTGLALGADGTLYVDDTLTSSISSISHAATRTTPLRASASVIASKGALNGPLGMVSLPDGHLLVVNGNDGNAVELDSSGHQLLSKTVIKDGAGDLFGIAVSSSGSSLLVANDGTNALDLYHS